MTVAVEDPFGNTVATDSSTVTLTLGSRTFASGGSTVTVAAVNGIATFSNLAIDAAGSYTMTASDGALAVVTSSNFAVTPAAATALAFTQQPSDTTAGAMVVPPVTVAVEDQFGNTITADNSTITLTLGSGTFASGSDTVTATAASGVATFSDLAIDVTGSYALDASVGIAISATSNNFTISPAAAACWFSCSSRRMSSKTVQSAPP